MAETDQTVKLNYSIHKFSSYSANYVPQNILENKPTDLLSRWFTDRNTSSQFIMLKLDSPAIVEKIVFGKYIKAHVSDLKKFKIFGGTDDENMSELLSAGLKNDISTETFSLRHRTKEGLYLPVTYIKIVPLQSWGPAYNYTIWYVELHGKNNEEFMRNAMETINLRKEEEAVRILLKHLRRRRYKDAFEALSRESGVRLEGPIQARLWSALVENGDYKLAEQIFDEAVEEGELEWYMSWQPYSPRWRLLSPCSAAVEESLSWSPPPIARRTERILEREPSTDCHSDYGALNGSDSFECCDPDESGCYNKPGPRGGHQLVVDPTTGTLYLFGGWNGTEDLDDLWSYCTREERWTLLCRSSGAAGGPSPRSCHKMVFDPVRRQLYTLGRYLDNAQRLPENMQSSLYAYEVETGSWRCECADTAAVGGPRLVFDHQMCLDADAATLYVFGGRVLPANTDESAFPQYSGLYAYYIATQTWQQLLGDKEEGSVRPRVGHSMLFHPIQRRLYIFAGQRNKEHLLDLWWFDPATRRGGAVTAAGRPPPAPPVHGFTQRATLDHDTDHMFVLSGMSKEVDKGVYNTLWAFSLRRKTWSCVYRNDKVLPTEPRPRFAHQLVYDSVKKIHYLFGGNPGNFSKPRLRLDDLWALELEKTSVSAVRAAARALVREARYRSLARAGRAAAALRYLRRDLHAALDPRQPDQVEHFQKLATVLFTGDETAADAAAAAGGCSLTAALSRRLARSKARVPTGAHAVSADRHLAAVLGADETIPDPPEPFEEISATYVDTWDVEDDGVEPTADDSECVRAARIALYNQLCKYFRPSVTPPQQDIMQLVKL